MAKRIRRATRRADRKPVRPDRQPVVRGAAELVAPVRKLMPPVEAPNAAGIALFEQAMEALQQKQYGIAAGRFRDLLRQFPTERALRDRTRVYLELVERELNRQPAEPRTLEERVTAATAALNNDQDADAERLVRSVLSDEPRHDLALYLMAVIEARRGDADAALACLDRAIAISPEVRAQARHDADFERLRHVDAFQALVDPPSAANPKKPRRGHRL